MDIVTWVIGGVVALIPGLLFAYKQHNISKTKDKTLVRVVGQHEEETPFLLKNVGSSTEPNKRGRAYIPIGKQKVKNPDTGDEYEVGNTFETWYPEGLPRFLQVRVRAMEVPEGSTTGMNLYSSHELSMVDVKRLTDYEVGTIHKEAYSKAVIETSQDTRDILKEVKDLIKPGISKVVVYLLLVIILAGVAGIAYLSWQNGAAISELKWW
jgi:hypothetical protein